MIIIIAIFIKIIYNYCEKYIIHEVSIMIFHFSKELYPKTALLKAAYSFTDRAYIHLDVNETEYIVDISIKPDEKEFSLKEFENELLFQSLKYSVFQQTKDIRKLIVTRALASTLIEEDTTIPTEDKEEDFDIDNILEDWFEKYDS